MSFDCAHPPADLSVSLSEGQTPQLGPQSNCWRHDTAAPSLRSDGSPHVSICFVKDPLHHQEMMHKHGSVI
ncbi:hypothetical protein DPX16_10254 [Anabarilius grahami]|uniref:Uncharacterized protein n=1 Tax=Anabarilius grahami TaxID=495550 RepID=A0A3N0Y0J5_ANAGA|nr:hypothetical protein DPX16_10254 [Anabarilius grahami]